MSKQCEHRNATGTATQRGTWFHCHQCGASFGYGDDFSSETEKAQQRYNELVREQEKIADEFNRLRDRERSVAEEMGTIRRQYKIEAVYHLSERTEPMSQKEKREDEWLSADLER